MNKKIEDVRKEVNNTIGSFASGGRSRFEIITYIELLSISIELLNKEIGHNKMDDELKEMIRNSTSHKVKNTN